MTEGMLYGGPFDGLTTDLTDTLLGETYWVGRQWWAAVYERQDDGSYRYVRSFDITAWAQHDEGE